ncbi:MAG: hypothetical protein L0H97_09195 [Lactococcus sp.]|jgi:hypothetical protein|nr:hypothetical protein [Lactococcus sp.]
MPLIKNINELNDRITIIKVESRSGPVYRVKQQQNYFYVGLKYELKILRMAKNN